MTTKLALTWPNGRVTKLSGRVTNIAFAESVGPLLSIGRVEIEGELGEDGAVPEVPIGKCGLAMQIGRQKLTVPAFVQMWWVETKPHGRWKLALLPVGPAEWLAARRKK